MKTEKAEITKMPEGMSSEELDVLTTGEESEQDTNLAQEALDATEEPSPAEESEQGETSAEEEKPAEEKPKAEEEVDPKDAVIGEFRRKLRDSEIETAKLQGELEARKAPTTTETPKSPLELAEAAYIEENGDLAGFAMSGALYRQQKAFEDEQATTKATESSKQQVNRAAVEAEDELQEGDLSVAKMGQGLDLSSVASIGQKHLTRGDRVDITDIAQTRGNKAALREAYKIMTRRVLAAGGADAKLIQDAINAKKAGKTQPKPKTEKPDIDALTTEGEDTDTGEAEADTPSKRLTDFVFAPD